MDTAKTWISNQKDQKGGNTAQENIAFSITVSQGELGGGVVVLGHLPASLSLVAFSSLSWSLSSTKPPFLPKSWEHFLHPYSKS